MCNSIRTFQTSQYFYIYGSRVRVQSTLDKMEPSGPDTRLVTEN